MPDEIIRGEAAIMAFTCQIRWGNHNNQTAIDQALMEGKWQLALLGQRTATKLSEIHRTLFEEAPHV